MSEGCVLGVRKRGRLWEGVQAPSFASFHAEKEASDLHKTTLTLNPIPKPEALNLKP